jgi:aminoglycoside 2''-phosphotransferase
VNADQVKQAIESSFPGFQARTVELAGEGMDSAAFTVNGEYVFRFPKYPEVAGKLKIEIDLLPALQDYVDIAIPQFEYIGVQQEGGLPFVGYRRIDGVELGQQLLLSLDTALRKRLIKKVAGFFNQLHDFPIEKAKQLGVGLSDFKNDYASDLERAQAEVYPLVDSSVQLYLERLFGGYLGNSDNFSYTPALLHADLSPEHIIYDSQKQDIAGIIDFGDIAIGDPDYEFMFLYKDYGRWFVEELIQHMPEIRSDALFPKLEFFMRCNTLHDVLIGLTRRDEQILEESLELLRREAEEQEMHQ